YLAGPHRDGADRGSGDQQGAAGHRHHPRGCAQLFCRLRGTGASAAARLVDTAPAHPLAAIAALHAGGGADRIVADLEDRIGLRSAGQRWRRGLSGQRLLPVLRRHGDPRLYDQLHPGGAGLRIWNFAGAGTEGLCMAPGLSIAIAEKRFESAPPLFSDFRLEVAPGSILALLGPSGIGKSSLLRLLAGIDRDFSGTIAIDGVAADRAPMPGFVFQDARLLPWLSARDNVLLAAPP